MEIMDEQETKSCPNCKREIPSINFTIHSVHCARNIKVCPVCKEPVPLADLQLHHDQMHKLLPCKKCGESVCGTDLEDHVRDSCAHTIKSCKYCNLELPRRELPAHEAYCGTRTELCDECREWVMIKYRQLHLDSNHGFLRLDDDPEPRPKKEVLKVRMPKVLNNNVASVSPLNAPSGSNGNLRSDILQPNNRMKYGPSSTVSPSNSSSNISPRPSSVGASSSFVKNTNAIRDRNAANNIRITDPPRTEIRHFTSDCVNSAGTSGLNLPKNNNNVIQAPVPIPVAANRNLASSSAGPSRAVLQPSNLQPQASNSQGQGDANRKCGSRGAVKKRVAPKPPEVPPDQKRDLPYYSALQRQQDEIRVRQEINADRLAQGLPPILTPAEKIEKLRKMDALQNREVEVDYSNRLQGRVWGGGANPESTGQTIGNDVARNYLKDLKPMTPEQFMERFNALRMGEGSEENGASNSGQESRRDGNDRFSMIKSSLQELRRGLNEVTAPYNSNMLVSDGAANEVHGMARRRVPQAREVDSSSDGGSDSDGEGEGEGEDVRLPCEFCGRPQPIDSLVQHQTGCRPDLAQLRAPPARAPPGPARPTPGPARSQPSPARPVPPVPFPDPEELPVIPCEFCTQSLPVYLISEHQERCRRDANPVYLD